MSTTPRRIRLTKPVELQEGRGVRKFDAGVLITDPSPELLAVADGRYKVIDDAVLEAREKLPKEKI